MQLPPFVRPPGRGEDWCRSRGCGHNKQPPNPTAMAHESLKGVWHIAEFLPKKHYDAKTRKESWRMNLYRRRTIPPNPLVHGSAFERGDAYRSQLPVDAIRFDNHPAGGHDGGGRGPATGRDLKRGHYGGGTPDSPGHRRILAPGTGSQSAALATHAIPGDLWR